MKNLRSYDGLVTFSWVCAVVAAGAIREVALSDDVPNVRASAWRCSRSIRTLGVVGLPSVEDETAGREQGQNVWPHPPDGHPDTGEIELAAVG